jgi:hypothetical protein
LQISANPHHSIDSLRENDSDIVSSCFATPLGRCPSRHSKTATPAQRATAPAAAHPGGGRLLAETRPGKARAAENGFARRLRGGVRRPRPRRRRRCPSDLPRRRRRPAKAACRSRGRHAQSRCREMSELSPHWIRRAWRPERYARLGQCPHAWKGYGRGGLANAVALPTVAPAGQR